jgi:hypothetical protein
MNTPKDSDKKYILIYNQLKEASNWVDSI